MEKDKHSKILTNIQHYFWGGTSPPHKTLKRIWSVIRRKSSARIQAICHQCWLRATWQIKFFVGPTNGKYDFWYCMYWINCWFSIVWVDGLNPLGWTILTLTVISASYSRNNQSRWHYKIQKYNKIEANVSHEVQAELPVCKYDWTLG